MTEIEMTISKGKTVRNKLLAMLHSHGYSSGPKNNLLVAYTDIAIEHHESIYYLIDSNLYGSAFSLVRSLFETLFRIHWVNKCASDEQIEKIYSNDHFHFPEMREIVTVIDKSYAGDNFFIDIKRNSWSAMCSYAHSGLLPISRRFTNGDISPNYKSEEILEVLNSSNMAVLLLRRLFFISMEQAIEAKETEKMILEYAVIT